MFLQIQMKNGFMFGYLEIKNWLLLTTTQLDHILQQPQPQQPQQATTIEQLVPMTMNPAMPTSAASFASISGMDPSLEKMTQTKRGETKTLAEAMSRERQEFLDATDVKKNPPMMMVPNM